MLVVRRRTGQAILIGDQVEVHVLEIGPGRVKLGVVAPREIPVIRAEVRLTREANLEAARSAAPDKLSELTRRLQSEAGEKKRGAGAGTGTGREAGSEGQPGEDR